MQGSEELRKKKKTSSMGLRKKYRFKTDASSMEASTEKLNLLQNRRNTDLTNISRIESTRDYLTNIPKNPQMLKKGIGQHNSSNAGSYLVRAMEGQKIAKITWESLFNMKEDSMHHNIVIPDIVKNYRED